MKTFLGQTGPLHGVELLDIILQQHATARHIAGRLFRFLVREDPSPAFQQRLGAALARGGFEIAPFLRTVFLSRDFYSPASVGTRIKGPVELIVSTYRRLGLPELPGVPDFNSVCGELGQVLLNPPTVAGWAQGRAWITPGTLLARGNFAREVMFPDMIEFTDPSLDPGAVVRSVNARMSPKTSRRITEPWRIAMKAKLETEDAKALYKKCKQTVEPVFGIIKSVIGFRRFSLRGIGKAATEWTLVTLAYNCKRMVTLETA